MKINKTRLVEIIKEELDNMQDSQNFHDSEGRMAKSQLLQIAEYATFLHNSLKDEDQLVSTKYFPVPPVVLPCNANPDLS